MGTVPAAENPAGGGAACGQHAGAGRLRGPGAKSGQEIGSAVVLPERAGWALTRVFGGRQIAVIGVLRNFRSSGGAVQPLKAR